MRFWLVLIALASTAHAEPPTPPAADDHRGLLVSAGIAAGPVHGSHGTAVGVEGTIGWGVTPWLAIVSRASTALVFDRESFEELQLGVRAWPLRDLLSIDLRAGRLDYSEEFDCQPPGNDCWGGQARGYSVGGALRAAVVRGRNGSVELFLERSELRWRDATTGVRDGVGVTRVGIGFSLHAALY